MFDPPPVYLPDRLTAAVTVEIGEAARARAAARGVTVADYIRGALQARLMLDGERFEHLPDLQRIQTKGPRR